jgi:signal transduction histidine kinase
VLNSVEGASEIAFALSNEVALACDGSATIRWTDERARRLLGAEIGGDFSALCSPGSETKARALVEAACAGPTDEWELVMHVATGPLLVAWRGAPNAGGAVLVGSPVLQRYLALEEALAGVVGDLSALQRETERRRRELGLAEKEKERLLVAERAARDEVEAQRGRLAQVLDRLPEAIVIVDGAGRISVANAAAAEVMGLDLIGQALPVGTEPAFGARRLDGSPIAAAELPLQRSALQAEVVRGEQFVIEHAQHGRDVPLLVSSAPLHRPDGTQDGAVAVFQDITSIKELERQKDEFLATVSHDLRNPLAGIKGWIQILQRRARQLPDDSRDRWQRDLSTVEAAATRMGAILDELMDLTQLQMGRPLELQRTSTDLVALARRVVMGYQQAAQGHTIHVRGDPACIEGFWDATRIERVVGNLISNAVKYSPAGGDISVDIRQPGDIAVLSVQDHGIGIPAEDLPRIFDRFYRASNATTHFAGTGIGLAGARQLVEQHGGSVEVRSTVNVGTTISITLPLGSYETVALKD